MRHGDRQEGQAGSYCPYRMEHREYGPIEADRMIVRVPDNWHEERNYVLSVILDTLLGVPYEVETAAGAEATSFHVNGRTLAIRDHFFARLRKSANPYRDDLLPEPTRDGSGMLAGLRILYGEDRALAEGNDLTIDADLVGSAFFMLSRWEELHLPKDDHGRAVGSASLAFREGFHLRPLVNEYAGFIRRWLEQAGMHVDPGHRFGKLFTCDVDMPFYWKSGPFRKLAGSFLGKYPDHPAFREKWKSWRAYRKDRRSDPYFNFRKLVRDAGEAGADIRFYFMAGGQTAFDPPGYLDDPGIRELLAWLAGEGHPIGLHGSYDSATDAAMLAAERQKLERAAGQPVKGLRQHYLRCDALDSPGIWAEAGFSEDATCAYADVPGFRHGICHPFPLFDLREGRMSGVTEWPLAFMDATFRHYLEASPADTVTVVEELLGQTREHAGSFVFLWHNSSFEYGGYRDYLPVYNSLLSY